MFTFPATMFSGAGTPPPPSNSRVAMANNAAFPTTFSTQSNWVHNCWTTHTSGPVDYASVEATFLNGLISTNSEPDAHYDFFLNSGLLLNGVFYQGLCSGSTTATVSKSWGTAKFSYGVSIPASTTFIITSRRIATDMGASGTYDVITTTAGINARQDGIIGGTNPTIDYTQGVGVAWGARCGPVVISGSSVSSIPVAAGGGTTGPYSGGLNLTLWYGPAGAGQPGALHPGSGAGSGGFGNTSGGVFSSVTVGSGGSGHSSGNPPQAFVGGASTAATGFGTTTATYGPTLITGIPSVPTPSVMLQGDSIMAGYGSVDTLGDLQGNYGVYEQTLACRYGHFKMAVSGESAAGWVANRTKQVAFVDAAIADGLTISHVILALGVNDFLSNNNSNVISVTQNNLDTIANIWRTRGASNVLMATIPPSTTGTFTSVGSQTPTLVGGTSTNYGPSGRVEQFNTALLGGTPTNQGVVDIRSQCQDSVSTWAWRTDAFSAGNAFTNDGIHMNVPTGIPWCVANLTIPALTV